MPASPRSSTTPDVSPGDRPTEHRAWLAPALVAVLVVLTFGSLRVLFPLAYNYGERTTFTSAGLLAVALFAIPIVTPVVRRLLGAWVSLVALVAALGVTRLAVQLVRPVPLWLAAVASVLALVALALAYTALRARGGEGGREFVTGLLVGLAVDTAIVVAFRSWEPAWQDGVGAFLVTVGTVVAALTLSWRAPVPGGEVRAGVWATAAIGPFLMLHLLFLQNAPFTGSVVGVPLSAAAALVLVGDALALLAVGWGIALGSWRRLAVGATLIVLAALVNEVTGVVAAAVLLVAHKAAALALSTALGTEGRSGVWRAGLGMTVASVSFLLLTLLFYLHYDLPLPFPNVVLAPIAAALLAAAMLRATPPAGTGIRLVAALPAALLVVPLALWVLSPPPGSQPVATTSIRVVNYNVHTTVDVRGQLDPEAIARVIEAQEPDVVVLQEVSRGWAVAGAVDSVEWLSPRLGLPYVYVPAADAAFGNAILSRFPILRTDEGLLPKGAGPMDRAWVRAVLDLGDGRELTVIGSHLHHQHAGPEDDRTRLDQIGVLLNVWGGVSRTVIAGDMNAEPETEEIARFEAAGFHTAGDPAVPTYPSTAPRDRIDYVFATLDLAFSDVEIPRSTASDHLAVATTVELGSGS
jgi:endonuclease/exonuclease/phosphatase family metal-dependent hydrolase